MSSWLSGFKRNKDGIGFTIMVKKVTSILLFLLKTWCNTLFKNTFTIKQVIGQTKESELIWTGSILIDYM